MTFAKLWVLIVWTAYSPDLPLYPTTLYYPSEARCAETREYIIEKFEGVASVDPKFSYIVGDCEK